MIITDAPTISSGNRLTTPITHKKSIISLIMMFVKSANKK